MNSRACISKIGSFAMMVGMIVGLSACGSLLPHGTQEAKAPWRSYDEAQQAFLLILPEKTRVTDLAAMGLDPTKTPNITILSHADLLRRLVATSSIDIRLLAPAVQECVAASTTCYAYQIEQSHIDRKRYGSFWADFLNFERKVDISGWQFDALIVIRNGVVTYKQWTGKPNIHQEENDRSPLGPLQGIGSSLLSR